MNRINLQIQKETKTNKWLAKVKVNRTLYLDDNQEWDYDKPDNVRQVLKRNTTLYIKENIEDEIREGCKYVAVVKKGYAVVGFYTLYDVIDWNCLDILEFTQKCKELYLNEKTEVRDEYVD